MTLTTWNVNSIRAHLAQTLAWVDAHEPDVLCLQELKCQDNEFPTSAFTDRGYHVATHGQKTYNGVAILSRLPLSAVERGLPDAGDPQARGITARCGDVRVVNLYVVNGEKVSSDKYTYKLDWLDKLAPAVAARRDGPMIVCGDFNIAPADRDVYDPAGFRDQVLCTVAERAALRRLLDLGLTDAWGGLNPTGVGYTWWDYRANGFAQDNGLRIDHHLVSADILARAVAVSIDREARGVQGASDHAPVTLHLVD